MRCKKWLAMTLALVLVLLPFGAASGEMEELILEEEPVQIVDEDDTAVVAGEEDAPVEEEEFILFEDDDDSDSELILVDDEASDPEPDAPIEVVEAFSVDYVEALRAIVDNLQGIEIYTADGSTSDLEMIAGTTLRLYADPLADPDALSDEDLANLAKTFIWTSSDEQVATVDGLGMVTAKKVAARQSVTITASAIGAESIVSGSIDIDVIPAAAGIVITLAGAEVTEVPVAGPTVLNYQVLPEDADQTVAVTASDEGAYVSCEVDEAAQTITLDYVANGFSTITVTKGTLSASVLAVAAKEGEPVAATIDGPAIVEVGLGKKIDLADWGVSVAPAGQTLTYKSSDKKIATVTADGVVKGVKAGTAKITVTCGTESKIIKVTVRAKPVTKVTVSKKSLLKDGTVQIAAGITPTNASKLVRWESDNESVATVDTDLIANKVTVTGVDYGTATITAYAMDGSGKKGSAVVTVGQPVAGVEITAANGANTVGVGKALQLTATLSGADSEAPIYTEGLTWTSDNKKIATVSSTGKVTGVKAGTVTITAIEKSDTTKTATYEVTVKAPITSVKIAGDAVIDLTNPAPLTLTATVKPAAAPAPIIWESSDEDLATVTWDPADPLTATVTAVDSAQGGTVTITAKATDGSKLKAAKTVTLSLPVTDMNIIALYGDGEADVNVAVGKTVKLSTFLGFEFEPAGATNKAVSYKVTSGGAYATVTSAGVVKGVKKGQAVIKIASKDNPDVYREVTVAVTPITKAIALYVDDGYEAYEKYVPLSDADTHVKLSPAITPEAASGKLTWKSSDETIATVDQTGLVTFPAGASGIVKITATATDGSGVAKGYKFYAMNPVTEFTLTGNTVNSEGASIVQVPVGKAVAITVDDFNDDASDVTLTWTSSNTKIATVSSAGKVKGIKAGSATITATAKYGSGDEAVQKIKVSVKAANTVATGISFKNSDDTPFTGTYLVAGQSLTVKAAVKPATALQNVDWTSSDETIATVTPESGSVTTVQALQPGEVTITALALDGSKKEKSFTLTVGPAPANIRIAGLHSITKGTTTTLIPVVKDGEGNVIKSDVVWASSDMTIATVDANGVVTGVKVGTAVIIATAIDGADVHAFFPIDVTPKATGVEVFWNGADWSKKTITVSKSLVALGSNTLQLNAHVLPDDSNATVTWKSSDTTIATVNANGIVTFKAKAGTAKITATVKDSTTVTGYVNIKVVSGDVGVTVSSALDAIAVGGTCEMSATLTNSSNGVTWTSSDETIATVDENGVVTAKAVGEVTITATAIDDPSKTAGKTLAIVRKINALSLDEEAAADTSIPWGYGDTEKMRELRDNLLGDNSEIDDDRAITWTSDNTDVATVDANGIVTVTKVGTANITATLNDGSENVSITIPVTVYEALLISSQDDLTVVYKNHTLVLEGAVNDTSLTNWDFEWTVTDNLTRVEYDATSVKIQGLDVGSATVTYTATNPANENDTVSAIFEVEVLPIIETFKINEPAEGWLYADTQLVMTLTADPAEAYVGGAVWGISDASPDPDAAEIDPNTGAVTVYQPGTVYITATFTYPDGVSQTATYESDGNTLEYYPLVIESDFEWEYVEAEGTDTTTTITAYDDVDNDDEGVVTIPACINGVSVTEIGDGAFQNNTDIESVSIPNGIKVIGASAFSGCSSLSSMTPY